MKFVTLSNVFRAPPPRRLYVVWPDGARYAIKRRHGAYWWSPTAGSYPLSAARENVERLGGKIVSTR